MLVLSKRDHQLQVYSQIQHLAISNHHLDEIISSISAFTVVLVVYLVSTIAMWVLEKNCEGQCLMKKPSFEKDPQEGSSRILARIPKR